MISKPRPSSVLSCALGAAALVASSFVASSGPAAAADSSGSYYVALGDSLAAGYQPGAGDDKSGGYVGYVFNQLQQTDPSVKLANLACSGEDTTTFTSGTICSYAEGNQLAAATGFLKEHPGKINLITIDLGANDVQRCVTSTSGSAPSVDFACVADGLQKVQANLPKIMTRIRAAAPDARIVMLNYYNPFLAAWLTGSSGQNLARLSAGLQGQLNTAINSAASDVDAKVADVATAFDSTDFTTMVQLPGAGEVPANVAMICTQTWMCRKSDIHANDTGYLTLGKTVAATVATMPLPTPTATASPTSSSSPASSSTSSHASSGTSTDDGASSSGSASGPPVITDGPAASNDNSDLLIGAGVASLIVLGATGVATRRASRR